MSWVISYLLYLFAFDASPGVTFATVVRNILNSKSLKIGIFTSLGAGLSDGSSAIIGFFFCSLLTKYATVFKIIQIIGMVVLFYIAIKMIITPCSGKLADVKNTKMTPKGAVWSGFIYTFTNIGICVVIMSVMSQYFHNVNSIAGYAFIVGVVPIMTFLTFVLVSVVIYFFKPVWNKLGDKYLKYTDKIAGIVILLLAISNVREIIGL